MNNQKRIHWWNIWRKKYSLSQKGMYYLAFTAGWNAAIFNISESSEIKIHYTFRGNDNSYHVFMNNEEIYSTKDGRDRDLFIAELKGRLISASSPLVA